MIKKISIIMFIIGINLLMGCEYDSFYCSDKRSTSPSFNQETYVWENFVITTNKVEVK